MCRGEWCVEGVVCSREWCMGVWGMGVWTKLFIITPHTKVRGTHLSHSGGRYDLRRNICSFQCPTQ